ncbi:pseudouridine synthase [Lewinella sp. 4G2]|uniref:pseudouridine synthase n=1 Tax=Lewinella sp. 4G2 TaxID=1803372 RepID=UPI0007B4BBC8|nr:pseudouridine synthase [Lewinella sp. 4G2]OAV43365.1 ribulose phosphate epimerase [Lewinella sp. 4G2]
MNPKTHHHYLLNKPHSVLSQFTHQHTKRKNKRMLGELYDFAPGTMAIGRLDENSEGLLLLTTDGKESERIRSAGVEKEYYARVLGELNEDALRQIREGVEIGFSGKKYRTLHCAVRKLEPAPEFSFPPRREHQSNHGPATWVAVTLREGKYRQVRKMLAAVGHPVIRLVRVRIGGIQLGDLASGEVREVAAFTQP